MPYGFRKKANRRRSIPDWLVPPHLARALRKRPKDDLDEGGVPVEPDNPKNLSGGAAAALEFDD